MPYKDSCIIAIAIITVVKTRQIILSLICLLLFFLVCAFL